MNLILIGNPSSGGGSGGDRLQHVGDTLRKLGAQVKIWPTSGPGHATELAAQAGGLPVVVAGGDGTVNEVINGLSPGATMGIIPLGTANVLARELGIPLQMEKACERVLTGQPLPIDLGVAINSNGEERRFACMAGLGFDARVIQAVTPRLKRYLKILAFPMMAFLEYLRHDSPPIQILSEEGSHGSHAVQFAIVTNSRYYGGGIQLTRNGSLTSGTLEVVLIDRVSMLLTPGLLARILARSPVDRYLRSFTANSLSAAPARERVPVQLDGEVWGELPMSFRIEPGFLSVIR